LEEEPIERDAQGRELVKLSIPTSAYDRGGIRALNQTIAQGAWDYVEVVFSFDSDSNGTFGDEYYVGAAIKGNEINLALPEGDYQAVMFAGIANGTKLLATGVPTATLVGAASTAISPATGAVTLALATTGIEFTLSALEMDPATDIKINGASSTDTVDVNGYRSVPYFYLNTGTAIANTNSSITIKGFNGGGNGVPDGDILTGATLFGLAGTHKITSTGVFASDPVSKQTFSPVEIPGLSIISAAIATGDLVIAFESSAPTADGFTKLRLDIPIQAFNTSGTTSAAPIDGQGHVWHIVTGIDDTALELGTAGSLGQNILLAIGSSPSIKTITVTGP
jgi:hypothetical protein